MVKPITRAEAQAQQVLNTLRALQRAQSKPPTDNKGEE